MDGRHRQRRCSGGDRIGGRLRRRVRPVDRLLGARRQHTVPDRRARALRLAVLINVITLPRHQPLMVLEAGTAVVFGVFVIMALTLSDDFLERWLQPLGNAGLFAIVLISILIGKPFTLQYARKSTPRELWNEPGFVYVCQLLAWVWAGAMAFMTIVSLIPPIVDGDATVRDADDTLSVVCYWVLPFVALGLAMLFTSKYPDWFVEASGGDDDDDAALARTTSDDRRPHGRRGRPGRAARTGRRPRRRDGDRTGDRRAAGRHRRPSAPRRSTPSGIAGDRRNRTCRRVGRAPAGRSRRARLVDGVRLAGRHTRPLHPARSGRRSTIVVAEAAGKRSHGTLVRRAAAADLDIQEVRAPGVVGRLFLPPTADAGARGRAVPRFRGRARLADLERRAARVARVRGARRRHVRRRRPAARRAAARSWTVCRSSASPMPSAGSPATSASTRRGSRRWRSREDQRACWRRRRG